MDTIARMVVAIIRVNGATSDQQGLALNTVIVRFLCEDKGEGDEDEEQEDDDDE